MTSDTVLRTALKDARLTPDQVSAEHMPLLRTHLDRGIRLFVAAGRQSQLRSELTELTEGASAAPLPSQTVAITRESDISEARMAARALCSALGARSLVAQKVTTIVSELARNIVSYTEGGQIELSVDDSTPRRVRVAAIDSGHGIANLDEIFSGRYKSSTGMGKGILGVKRLANTFDIRTGSTGTHIEVSISL